MCVVHCFWTLSLRNPSVNPSLRFIPVRAEKRRDSGGTPDATFQSTTLCGKNPNQVVKKARKEGTQEGVAFSASSAIRCAKWR
jgi:hypothetical protein